MRAELSCGQNHEDEGCSLNGMLVVDYCDPLREPIPVPVNNPNGNDRK
jgi:hypothetical protein